MNKPVTNIDNTILDSVRIGSQIRDLRKSKNISITVMAEKTGKSIGYISQVERGVSSLSIPTLQSISEVLDVQIAWFFHTDNDVELDELNHIVRKNERRSINFSGKGIKEELLSSRLSGHFLSILATFAPGFESDKSPRKRKGEESGFVQSGSLELTIGKQHFLLTEGDSFTLFGDEPHFLRNPSKKEEAVVIWTLLSANY